MTKMTYTDATNQDTDRDSTTWKEDESDSKDSDGDEWCTLR